MEAYLMACRWWWIHKDTRVHHYSQSGINSNGGNRLIWAFATHTPDAEPMRTEPMRTESFKKV